MGRWQEDKMSNFQNVHKRPNPGKSSWTTTVNQDNKDAATTTTTNASYPPPLALAPPHQMIPMMMVDVPAVPTFSNTNRKRERPQA